MTARPIRPDQLLRLAHDLATQPEGPGRPVVERLRRAISTAYYGLFHEVALQSARQALPDLHADLASGLARSVQHDAVTKVCGWVDGNTSPMHLRALVDRLRVDNELTAVAQTLVALKDRRHEADYDHLLEVSRAGAVTAVADAEAAAALLREHRERPTFRAFHSLVLLCSTAR